MTAIDAHTIRCPVVNGVTCIPIPSDTGKNFAGLFTVELPGSVRVGQEFRLRVRRVTTRRPSEAIGVVADQATATTAKASFSEKFMRNWRYVTGTFQVTIPVGTDEALLPPEETALAVLKWRREHMSPASRWLAVLERLIQYVSGRVDGFGGDAPSIGPSLHGAPPRRGPRTKEGEHCGKVREVVYDGFGDFVGFRLQDSCCDGKFFGCREKSVGELVLRACKDRLRVTVVVDEERDDRICEVRLCC